MVATRDHHVDPGHHFSEHPDFLDTWPAHCVVGTGGVELHPALDREPLEAIFDKGEHAAAYSGFEGAADGVPLADWLRARGVDAVDVVGIATDHCVRATALDAVGNGFAHARPAAAHGRGRRGVGGGSPRPAAHRRRPAGGFGSPAVTGVAPVGVAG